MKRNATAVWNGSGKEGTGNLTTQSTTLNHTQYSFNSRFADGVGTNPEELIAAAHAGCFSMKLSFVIGEAGLTPTEIQTTATVTLESGSITDIHLEVRATVPGATASQFEEMAENAKMNCPVSKVLNATISMTAALAN
jgi:lipoyl-dependent peroxiredoxin